MTYIMQNPLYIDGIFICCNLPAVYICMVQYVYISIPPSENILITVVNIGKISTRRAYIKPLSHDQIFFDKFYMSNVFAQKLTS